MPRPPIPSCPPARSTGGFTLVEVIMAIGILTVAIGGIISYTGSLHQRARLSESQSAGAAVAKALAERLQGARWEWLGTSRLPWSYGRYLSSSIASHPPMTLTGTGDDNLSELGFTLAGVGGENMAVYLEYYRGIDLTDANGNAIAGFPGIYSEATLTRASDFGKTFLAVPNDQTSPIANAYWLRLEDGSTYAASGTQSPTALVQENAPLGVRIIVTWVVNNGVFKTPTSCVLFTAVRYAPQDS